ncbi:MAG: DNA polymerase III subunit delta [Candidatus Omnitrophica bacterium]|nr:DNA polymerase III subunit delta [Candidatus Omnitrophota bacterium]
MVKSKTYWDILKNIKSKKIDVLYLFTQEELFLKRQVEELLKDAVVGKTSADFNYNVFYAEDASIDEVLDTIKTNPFLGEKRLVILKDVEKYSPHEKKLTVFLKNPAPKTVFIMETVKKSSDKFIKKIASFATEVMFSQLNGFALNKWISEYAESKGKQISSAGIALLLEKVGNELDVIVNALNKLFLYAGESLIISEMDIESLIKKTRQDTRFSFLNALMSKHTGKALEMAIELSRNGKHATDLIGLINWQLKRVERVKQLTESGFSKDRMAKELKITPYVLNIIHTQAARFTTQEIKRGFELLLSSDVAIKQGLKSPGLTLEILIVQLCTNK